MLGEVERRDGDRFDDAAEVFRDVALREEFPTFLTLDAYSRYLVETDVAASETASGRRDGGIHPLSRVALRLAARDRAAFVDPVESRSTPFT